MIDQTLRVKFFVTLDGDRNLVTPTSAPVSGTTGDFIFLINPLKPKHPARIEPIVYFADGTSSVIGAWPFDAGLIANVDSLAVAYNDTVATVTANFDTDTVLGAGKGRYRVDAGSWTTITVVSGQSAQFDVTLSPTAKQSVEVQGMNDDGNWARRHSANSTSTSRSDLR